MKIIPLLFPVYIFLLLGCSSQQLTSIYKSASPVVDGRGSDWRDIPMSFNKDLNIALRSMHTDSMLYIFLQTDNPHTAAQMGRRSFTIYLDKDKNSGIRYQDDQSFAVREKYIPKGFFSFIKKDKAINRELSKSDFIKAAFDEEYGYYGLEIGIPLYGNTSVPKLMDINQGRTYLVLEIGPLFTGMEKHKKRQQYSGNRGAASGMGRGGRRGGGGNRREHQSAERLDPGKHTLNITITLENKPNLPNK